jgi:hypothetical protein
MKFTVPLVAAAAILGFACATYADQPHMQASLQSLLSAKEELQQASRDKGGHRVRAEQLVNQAIAEVRAGIEFDRTHLSPGEAAR